MGEPQPSCRLEVLFASSSRKAVVFRRGPSKSVRLILWDRSNDTFEAGQWIRRSSVYPERSDLSPDGEYLVTFIGTFRPPFQTFTILSRPPYFTALSLWPKGDTWGGGGRFVGPREIALDHPDGQLAEGFALPQGFRAYPIDPVAQLALQKVWARRPHLWRPSKADASCWIMRHDANFSLVARPKARRRYIGQVEHAMRTPRGETSLGGAEWASLDDNGDILFAIGGSLFRIAANAAAMIGPDDDVVARAHRISDFTQMRFEPIVAPYGPATPGSEGGTTTTAADFQPQLDRVSKEDRRRRKANRKAARPSERGAP